ncbi:MAG: S-methyl-5'-thioadenosine phosphorylase [Myxococcota bacterium]
MTTIGIIGGSGLYALEGLSDVQEVAVPTPYGPTSDSMITGRLGDTRLVFLPRHGRGHRLTPAEVPYRANVFAMKSLGVEWLVSVSAVGSMKEHIHPGDLVVPDQYLDRTHGRDRSFFGDGVVAHVSMADPVCITAAKHFVAQARAQGLDVHDGGSLVTIDGPQFSTRAESFAYRAMGVDIIGMTAMPEAKLAREAEMHYVTLGLVTDYDCWHTSAEPVTVEAVIAILKANSARAQKLLEKALPAIAGLDKRCACDAALSVAIVTDRSLIAKERIAQLGPIVRKYLA